MPDREYLSLMGGEMWVERPASPWIAVADRAPPPEAGWVLVHSTESGYGIECADDIDCTVTHWMPIPDLPGAPT